MTENIRVSITKNITNPVLMTERIGVETLIYRSFKKCYRWKRQENV